MNFGLESDFTDSIQGQVLRLSERHEAALFLHDGNLWIADFVNGDGELMDVITWIRFNCGGPSAGKMQQRMTLESAIPLSKELAGRIEALCRNRAAQRAGRVVEGMYAIAEARIHPNGNPETGSSE